MNGPPDGGAPPPDPPTRVEAIDDPPLPAARTAEDVVYVHGQTETGVQITRLRDDRLESGELRPMKDGQPIIGEVVTLSPRKEHERLFDVQVLAKGPKPNAKNDVAATNHKGPPRVTSESYRSNWDMIFATKKKGELPS